MDSLEKGAWIINSIKHLSGIRTDTPELSFYDVTEKAGKAGLLLSRLVSSKEEVLDYGKTKIFARQSGINSIELDVYLKQLKDAGKIDYIFDNFNKKIKEIEIYCFSNKDVIQTTANLYDKWSPGEIENGNLIALEATYELPRYKDELLEIITKNGINEENAITIIEAQKIFGLTKISQSEEEIIYNEYAFNNNPIKIKKALRGLSSEQCETIELVRKRVEKCQGLLETELKDIDSNILKMMEGIGLIDGITVESSIGSATFFTTPQLRGKGIGKFNIEDIFHKAKILLSCLRFGQSKSYSGRGSISSNEKLLNIVKKLNRLDWVGKCTAIGEDYRLLELDGVIQTKPTPDGMFYMQLRQPEVGALVEQMINYNKVIDADNFDLSIFSKQPRAYIIPEVRRGNINQEQTEPVRAMREQVLQSLRTGGAV